MVGQTISHYRIIEKLGEGGMGVVYKAEDTQLRRTVALKFLSGQTVENEEVKTRLIREAQASASLDHANICPVYGIHEQDGETFIAMAYIDGPSLADKTKDRPLPLEEALSIATQIAEGLQEAHEKGIVHRDIKPQNIMLTAKGQVKIMDFGLASLAGRSRITKSGTMLGTPAYMAPEQLEGGDVDRRADIWALGVALYEMLTQRTPFEAEHEQAVAYRILNEEPEPVTALRSGLPTDIDRLIDKALAKAPEHRYQHADEIAVDLLRLKGSSDGGRSAPVSSVGRHKMTRVSAWSNIAPWVVAGLVCLAVAAAWLSPRPTEISHERTVRRFSYQPPRRLSGGPSSYQRPNIAISPDGTRLAYVATHDGVEQLVLRDLREADQLQSVAGSAGAHGPFFSTDSRHLGFFAGGHLKRMALATGVVSEIADVLPVSNGGHWTPTDEIYFLMFPRSGVKKVAASGGKVEDVTIPRYESTDQGHLSPTVLPGAEAILFTQWPGQGLAGLSIQALSFENGEQKTIVEAGSSPKFVDGRLVYAHEGKLLATLFDVSELETTGPPRVIANDVDTSLIAEYDVSHEGTLVFVRAGVWNPQRKLVEVDHEGNSRTLTSFQGALMDAALSPDGTHVAVGALADTGLDVWTSSLFPRESPLTRITFDELLTFCPTWTPDNQRVAYTQALPGEPPEMFWKAADGSGEPELLFEMPHAQFPTSFSPDGSALAFNNEDPVTDFDIFILDVAARKATPFRKTEFNEGMAKFHPSGKWIAYHSDRSGKYEVYVADYPTGSERQVSPDGGTNPVWSPDGRKLFYRKGDKFWLTTFTSEPELMIDRPTLLFERPHLPRGNYADSYGINAEGGIVLIDLDPEEIKPSEISIVLNWNAGLGAK